MILKGAVGLVWIISPLALFHLGHCRRGRSEGGCGEGVMLGWARALWQLEACLALPASPGADAASLALAGISSCWGFQLCFNWCKTVALRSADSVHDFNELT